MAQIRILILAATTLLSSAHIALADTWLCRGDGQVHRVVRSIKVSPEEFERFDAALHGFATTKNYFVLPSANPAPTGPGIIDLMLVKNNQSGEAIHISNRKQPHRIVASMAECGTKGFLPYWHEFKKFVGAYENSK